MRTGRGEIRTLHSSDRHHRLTRSSISSNACAAARTAVPLSISGAGARQPGRICNFLKRWRRSAPAATARRISFPDLWLRARMPHSRLASGVVSVTTRAPRVSDPVVSSADSELRAHVERVLSDHYELDSEIWRGVMGVVDHSVPVGLVSIDRPRLQNLTGFLRLRDAHRRRGLPSAIVEIEQHDIVPRGGEAGDRAATAILGISRMSTCDNDLILFRLCRRRARILRGTVQCHYSCSNSCPGQQFSTIHGPLPWVPTSRALREVGTEPV